ncbi:MAG: O-antigen ligase family protein [Gemmatimonadota bacterium]
MRSLPTARSTATFPWAGGTMRARRRANPATAGRFSLIAELRRLATLRNGVLAALVLTYIWRYHDMAAILQPFRLAAIATVASWGYLVFEPRMSQLGRALKLPYVWMLVVWMLWVAATSPAAIDPDRAWDAWLNTHSKSLTMALFTLTCLVSFRAVRGLMAVHVLGAATLTYFYVKGGFPLWGTPVSMYDVNDLALLLNMVLPMTLYFAFSEKDTKIKAVLWIIAGMMAVSILMTQSRGGFLTLGLLLLVLWVRVRGIKWWVRLVPAIALVVGFFFLPASVQDRLSTLFSPTEDYNYADQEGRVEIWKRGMGYLADRPITGVGTLNFPVAEATLSPQAQRGLPAGARVSHNSFVEVATETGYPGIILYLGMFLTAFLALFRLRRTCARVRGSSQAAELTLCADCLMLSLMAFCVGGFFLSMGYIAMLFSLFALIAGLEITAAQWLAAGSPAASATLSNGFGGRMSRRISGHSRPVGRRGFDAESLPPLARPGRA